MVDTGCTNNPLLACLAPARHQADAFAIPHAPQDQESEWDKCGGLRPLRVSQASIP